MDTAPRRGGLSVDAEQVDYEDEGLVGPDRPAGATAAALAEPERALSDALGPLLVNFDAHVAVR